MSIYCYNPHITYPVYFAEQEEEENEFMPLAREFA